ncbi:hypothetical protein AA313_de0205116 [Arthrobotrys entomopaga]|nr:hypothetical protein AA313_de0205116 [Arthrobotrys entomopaga]
MERSNPSKSLNDGYQGFSSAGISNCFHPSELSHADLVPGISDYLLKLLTEYKAVTSRSSSRNQDNRSKKQMLVRCITIDPNTLEVCSPLPPAYRVIEVHGNETYEEVVELVTRKFRLDDTPSKILRSIQCHDASESIQIIVDGDDAVRYFLEHVDELRMSVFAFDDGKVYISEGEDRQLQSMLSLPPTSTLPLARTVRLRGSTLTLTKTVIPTDLLLLVVALTLMIAIINSAAAVGHGTPHTRIEVVINAPDLSVRLWRKSIPSDAVIMSVTYEIIIAREASSLLAPIPPLRLHHILSLQDKTKTLYLLAG